LGVGCFFLRTRHNMDRFLPLISLAFVPLAVVKVHFSGPPGMVTYGLLMTLTAAVFIGYLSSVARGTKLSWVPKVVVLSTVLLAALLMPREIGVPTLSGLRAEANGPQDLGVVSTSEWLRNNYDGGMVLMEISGNEEVVFGSRIPEDRHIYEGNFRIWESSLANPVSNDIAWIYMRTAEGEQDQVWRRLHDRQELLHCYYLAYQHEPYHMIYHWRSC
jgi:hypothetical protein